MDEDPGKRAPAGNAPANALFILVALLAGALLVRQVPMTELRPTTSEPKASPYPAAQDVDARLWQDPIGAVARVAKDDKQGACDAGEGQQLAHCAVAVARTVEERRNRNPMFLGVVVPGAPYAGSAEWRRRARFAVVAGLKQAGYVPDDAQHIGYFRLHRELLDKMAGKSLPKSAKVTKPGTTKASSEEENASAKPIPAEHYLAYEWFVASDPAALRDNNGGAILVLWLDQDVFSDLTVDRIEKLFAYLGANLGKPPSVHVLGPGDSQVLRQMVQEALSKKVRPERKIALHFYDYAATIPDNELIGQRNGNAPTDPLQAIMGKQGIALLRTIADDATLACALRDELALRGIPPHGPPDDQERSAIVLISEWDTEYGRALSKTVRDALTGARECAPAAIGRPRRGESGSTRPLTIETYTYLRGLDGRLPGTNLEARDPGPVRAINDKEKSSSDAPVDGKQVERAEGQGQVDYLKRLAQQLRVTDKRARGSKEPRIRAIGVLGSDVYDKLVVLQVLRPMFPDALFFTTDLDARMMHSNELDWTRNVLVASSFGLELAHELQPGVPPFRDGYQTSLYLSTLLALSNARQGRCNSIEAGGGCTKIQENIDEWRNRARVFEIGWRGPFDLTKVPQPPAGAGVTPGIKATCDLADPLAKCASVHPVSRTTRPSDYVGGWRLTFLATALGVLAFLLVTGRGTRIGQWARQLASEPPTASSGATKLRLAVLVTACVGLVFVLGLTLPRGLQWLVETLTERGDGVPMTLLDGVSIWPTELIRLLALALAVWFIWRGWRNLNLNLDLVATTMGWTRERAALIADVKEDYKKWTWWQRVLHAFSFNLDWKDMTGPTGDPDPVETDAAIAPSSRSGLRPEAEEFWRKYIYQGRFGVRLVRVTVAVVLYFVFAIAVTAVFGFTKNPVRGELAEHLDSWIILAAVIATQFLIFFVVDATVLCYQFIRAISRPGGTASSSSSMDQFDAVPSITRWPEATLTRFAEKKLNVERPYADQWITIHVIGLRTKAVSRLIYYPYVILSLVILARSPVFDNWSMPVALIIILATSVAIVTVCAILLRSAAEYARRKAIWRLTNELIRLNDGKEDHAHTAKQLEVMIAQIHKYDTGSFASYLDQPILRAVTLPLGSVGGATFLQYLAA